VPHAGPLSPVCLTRLPPSTLNFCWQHFHGTNDTLNDYADAVRTIERYTQEIVHCVDAPVVRVRLRDHCASANGVRACAACGCPVQETFRNNSATCVTWNECDGGTEVTFCTIDGGGHNWPGLSAGRRRRAPRGALTDAVRQAGRCTAFRLLQRVRGRNSGYQRHARDVEVLQPRLRRRPALATR